MKIVYVLWISFFSCLWPMEPMGPIKRAETKQSGKYINSLGMTFVLIRPGTFIMGSRRGYDWEKPPHRVTLTKKFYIMTTEVTQRQWRAIMGANPSENPECGDDCPVENVSWVDVQAFICKLNERKEGVYRLPTEAEWEYACRAGREWSTFDNLDRYIWCHDTAEGSIHPVAQKKPNPWGLYDVLGNVREWCADYLGDYSQKAEIDPRGPKNGGGLVTRGGCYLSYYNECHCFSRIDKKPEVRDVDTGFRLVMDFSDQKQVNQR